MREESAVKTQKPQQNQKETYLQAAVEEYGGENAAAAVCCLGKIYDCYVDESVLCADLGICFDGMAGGAWEAYIGSCQFLSIAAHRQGMSRKQLREMCRIWQQMFLRNQQEKEEPTDFAGTIRLFSVFMEEHCRELGLPGAEYSMEKPRQYYENIYADRESMFVHSPFALEEKLTKAVTRGRGEEALKALHEIRSRGEKAVLAKSPLRSAKNSMIGSIAFLSRAAIQAGVAADDAFALSDALTQRVEEMENRSSVLAFEENILLQFIELVQERLKHFYSPPVMRAVHFIENRLNEKVTLSDAAAYAGVHPAYLSARFKKETGMAFGMYAAVRKIQESTYFVRHTDYSMAEIAALYGFSSQSYYITTFKKVMEMTPAQYRQKYT